MSYVLKKNYVLKTTFQRSFRDNHEDLGLCADLLNTFYIPNPFRGFIPYRSAHSAYTYNTHKPLWLSEKTMLKKLSAVSQHIQQLTGCCDLTLRWSQRDKGWAWRSHLYPLLGARQCWRWIAGAIKQDV